MYSIVVQKGFFNWIVYLDNADNGPWIVFDFPNNKEAVAFAKDLVMMFLSFSQDLHRI